jgi:predicted ATPase
LRALALVTALGVPAKRRPWFMAIDEPELGLHPSALGLIAGLVKSVSSRTQVVLATHSPALLDHFDPADVVVTERRDDGSVFRRLDPTELETWLDEYTLSELYDKNVLGGRP